MYPLIYFDCTLYNIYTYIINFLFQNVLVSPSEDQYELLLRRLKERIQDGGSETIFEIGIAEGIDFSKCSKVKKMQYLVTN